MTGMDVDLTLAGVCAVTAVAAGGGAVRYARTGAAWQAVTLGAGAAAAALTTLGFALPSVAVTFGLAVVPVLISGVGVGRLWEARIRDAAEADPPPVQVAVGVIEPPRHPDVVVARRRPAPVCAGRDTGSHA